MKRSIWLTPPLLSLLLAACDPVATMQTPPPTLAAPPPPTQPGLDRVMNRDQRALRLLFGEPELDVREGPARKLQFRSAACVLDTYLYPPAEGREPIVRYMEARRPDGFDVDRTSCIAALTRR
jgi:hypothetical protein